MVNESDFKANTVASFNFDEEYPGINSLKVKAIIKVVTEIKKIAPMVATTKHSLSLILKKISLQSILIQNKRFCEYFRSSFFLFNLFLTYIFFM
jgi:hypothetical protein